MVFPQSCSHLLNWLFKDEQELRLRRTQTLGTIAATIKTIAPEAECLTVEEECELVRYFSRQLLYVCQHHGLDYRVQSTAAAFFSRFYINRSVIEYDPRTILLTCILLAIKSEEESNVINIRHLFEGADGIDVEEVFRNELAVLDAICFHLMVLHVRTPLQFLCDGYFSSHRSGLSPQDIDSLQKCIRCVNKTAEELGLRLHRTDIPLLFSPSQIAIALFSHCSKGQLEGVDKHVEILFMKDMTLCQRLMEKVSDIKSRIVVEEAMDRESAEDYRSCILELLRKADRLRKRLKKVKWEKR